MSEESIEYEENRDYEGLTVYDEMAAITDEDIEETRLKRLSKEFSKVGGVRDV